MAYNIIGENLIKYPYCQTTLTQNGVTFTDNGDRTITANGTATNEAIMRASYFGKKENELTLEPGTYILGGGTNSVRMQMIYSYDDWANTKYSYGAYLNPVSITITSRVRARINVSVLKGDTANNETATPFLAKAVTLADTYQLVLVRNRVVDFGSDCFVAMGGTVICEETGKKYEHATIATTSTPPPYDLGRIGYEFIEGTFVPCEPFGKTDAGYLITACDDCKTPRQTTIPTAKVKELVDTYATIDVTYPNGSVCTLKKNAITLTADGTAGFESFNVPSAGTWTITITDGTKTQTKTVSITKRWQYEAISIAYFSAAIKVTYPAKSTCTCKNGSTTLTDTNTGTSAKTATFTVPNAGTWTITATATDGTGNSKQTTVSIAASPTTGQSVSVELSYTLMLYNNGEEYADVTGGWTIVNKSGGGDGAKEANRIYLGYTGSSNRRSTAYTTKKVDVSKVSTLYVKVNITTIGAGVSGSGFHFGLSEQNTDVQPYESELFAGYKGDSTTGEKILSLDVSSFSATYYICLHAHTTKCYVTEVYAV